MAEAKRGMKFGEKEYAFVPDRIKQFREENAHGSIETEPTWLPDGGLMFKTTIVRDLSDKHSARATGNATYSAEEMKKLKAFEKLETVSVGRALSMIGYLNDGQVASTEELQELAEYKEQQRLEQQQEAIEQALEAFKAADSLDALKTAFAAFKQLWNDPLVVDAKNTRKEELQAILDAEAKVARPTGGKKVEEPSENS